MFETTNLLPIRYLQDKDTAKVFLEALLGKSISGIERFYWRTNLPEAFDLRQGKPDIYLEDQNKNQYAILERRYGFDCGYQDTVSRFIQNAMSADSLSYHGTVSECSESYIIFLSHLGCFGQSDAICDLSDVSAAGNMAQQREQGSVTFAEVPVPGKECCNEAEHSATLYVGNVRIDIYSSCGREQLKTLVEMLHIC